MRIRRIASVLLLSAALSPAYYHFVRYQSVTGPFVPIYDRFDLNALPGRTVPFLISSGGPSALADGDSPAAIVSQIRAAAAVWNTVATAEIKLKFAGFYSEGAVSNTPWVQVEFTDELPPGVLAQGGPVSRLDPAEGSDGVYVPIARSLVRLPKDLSGRPSYTERLFLTLVHEFGHALGLQHTWTSGVMSTEITRSTTKAVPLSSDDAAALSVLYPTAQFASLTGEITGRVTLDGVGVALASVVALPPDGRPVSALTGPEGYFRIQGLPPGQYFVYAHPLPPSVGGEPQPVNLELPVGPNGRIDPGPAFDTVFYPGTTTPGATVTVEAAGIVGEINFAVAPRSAVNLYGVQTYTFIGREAVKPATFVFPSGGTFYFTGYGATAALPGFSLGLISSPDTIVEGSLRDYTAGFLQADVAFTPFSGTGPRHLLFTSGGESYVLPAGISVTSRHPPAIDSITPNGDGSFTLTGPELDGKTRVWIDGAQAKTLSSDGQLTVTPPPADPGHRGIIAAFNPDGQSSLSVHGASSPSWTYDNTPPVQISVSPASIPAGVETVLEITGSGVDFTAWPASLGFGVSDVALRQVFTVAPDRAYAWVASSPSATPSTAALTVSAGLAASSFPSAFQIVPRGAAPYFVMSALPKSPIYAGMPVVLPVSGGPAAASLADISAAVGGLPALVADYASDHLTIQIPAGIQPGPALLEAKIGGYDALPGLIVISPPPPFIFLAETILAAQVTDLNPARPGQTVALLAAGVGSGAEPIGIQRVKVFTGDVQHTVLSVSPSTTYAGAYVVEVAISASSPGSTPLPLTISVDDRVATAPFLLPYRP